MTTITRLTISICIISCTMYHFWYINKNYRFLELNGFKTLPNDSDNEILQIYVQITDTHFTHQTKKINDRKISEFFDEMDIINPKWIVHTGDISDGISVDDYSVDYKDFELWKNIKARSKHKIYDIRGNHDIFGCDEEKNKEVENCFFNKKRNFYKIEKVGEFKHLFVFVDATPKIGMKRIMSLFGSFSDKKFEAKLKKIKKENVFEQIFLFCHYPRNNINTNMDSVFESSVYMCGHIHFNLESDRTKNNIPCKQLILMDWKYNRRYRIFTIYGREFSFNNFKIGHPKVLIVSPTIKKTKKLRFIKYFCDDFIIKVDDKVYNTKIDEENNHFSCDLPDNYSKIEIIGIKDKIKSSHKIKIPYKAKTHFFMDLKYNYLFYVLNTIFVLILLYSNKNKGFILCGIKYILEHIFPGQYMRVYMKKWKFLTIYSIGDHYTYDIIYNYIISLFIVDMFLILYVINSCFTFLVIYNGLIIMSYIFYAIHYGFFISFNVLFLIFFDIYVYMRYRKIKKKNSSKKN